MNTYQIEFYKYHGAGNDFIIIDHRELGGTINWTQSLIEHLCNRRFGIGADGLMLIERHETLDFRMSYFNSDGRESTMCGNGGRCITALAHRLKVFSGTECIFQASDGAHRAKLIDPQTISLQMIDVDRIHYREKDFELHTGSPHYVRFVTDLDQMDVFHEGRKVRQSAPYNEEGINVNFVQEVDGLLKIRTYERGVEDETLACGTGVTAAVLAFVDDKMPLESQGTVQVRASGGELSVTYRKDQSGFTDIWLTGPARFVFKGSYQHLH